MKEEEAQQNLDSTDKASSSINVMRVVSDYKVRMLILTKMITCQLLLHFLEKSRRKRKPILVRFCAF